MNESRQTSIMQPFSSPVASSVTNQPNQCCIYSVQNRYRSRWEIRQASKHVFMTNGMWCIYQSTLFPPSCFNEMHLLFLLGVWICYVCTEYASAGFVKGCGYPCQAVLAFGVQSVYIFLFRRLDCNCFIFFFSIVKAHGSPWRISLLGLIDWPVTWPG